MSILKKVLIGAGGAAITAIAGPVVAPIVIVAGLAGTKVIETILNQKEINKLEEEISNKKMIFKKLEEKANNLKFVEIPNFKEKLNESEIEKSNSRSILKSLNVKLNDEKNTEKEFYGLLKAIVSEFILDKNSDKIETSILKIEKDNTNAVISINKIIRDGLVASGSSCNHRFYSDSSKIISSEILSFGNSKIDFLKKELNLLNEKISEITNIMDSLCLEINLIKENKKKCTNELKNIKVEVENLELKYLFSNKNVKIYISLIQSESLEVLKNSLEILLQESLNEKLNKNLRNIYTKITKEGFYYE